MGKKSRKKRNYSSNRRPKGTGFFAYPSDDYAHADLIERAIVQINKKTQMRIRSWRDLSKSTSRIISNILAEIESSDYLLADISGLNPNVLFEVGFAFAKRKRLILTIQGNSEEERNKDRKQIDMLSGIDIQCIQNSSNLLNLVKDVMRNGSVVYPDIEMYGVNFDTQPSSGLFLKGITNHELVINALEVFQEKFGHTLVDDWNEDRSQPLTWYIQAVAQSIGIAAVLVPDHWDQSAEVNARFSFVCGLAVGLEKTLQIIAPEAYRPAFDYKDLLKIVRSVDDARRIISRAFSDPPRASSAYAQLTPPKKGVRPPSQAEKELILLDVTIGNIGDTIAENEEADLREYFIKTAQFREALQGRGVVFVGSKGSGKTANFLQLCDAYSVDTRNIVCSIKPKDYRMSRLLAALRKVSEPHGGPSHISENVWKFVLYCYLIEALYERVVSRPLYTGQTEEEKRLVEFVEEHLAIIRAPIEKKLELAACILEDGNYNQDNFSKRIHEVFISSATNVIRPLLAKIPKAVVIIDNLDKAWDKGQDLDLQAKMVFALLGIGRTIEAELNSVTTVNVVIFLRRNIFEYMIRAARERDKLLSQKMELVWNDQNMLLAVIEKRIEIACKRVGVSQVDPWSSLFVPEVDDIPTRAWIYSNILPRPRDLINLTKKAMEIAFNRGHSQIQATDLKDALESYSAFAVNQMIAEYQAEHPWIVPLTSSFTGLFSKITLRELLRSITELVNEGGWQIDAKSIVSVYLEAGFFGLELSESRVRYATTLEDGLTLKDKLTNHPRRHPLRLVVHPVFHQHLSITQHPEQKTGILSVLSSVLGR